VQIVRAGTVTYARQSQIYAKLLDGSADLGFGKLDSPRALSPTGKKPLRESDFGSCYEQMSASGANFENGRMLPRRSISIRQPACAMRENSIVNPPALYVRPGAGVLWLLGRWRHFPPSISVVV